MMSSNPNRIKQDGICCVYCGKSYKTRKNLENHSILCEIIAKTKNSKTKNAIQVIEKEEEIAKDEEQNMLSHKQLYQIIVELTSKYNRLEAKIAQLEPLLIQKRRTVNVLDQISSVVSEYTFDEMTSKINIIERDIEYLFRHSCIDTFQEILTREIYDKYEYTNSSQEISIPLFASSTKNHIYVYTNKNQWSELQKETLAHFLNKLHAKFIQMISLWKQQKKEEMATSSDLTELYNNAIGKLMNMDFKKESTISRFRSKMYSRIKTEM